MEWLIIVFVLLPVLVTGVVLWGTRLARRSAVPDETADLAGNSIIAEEWEVVRRNHCLPCQCPRTIGQPPRPRRDTHCEICAAMYLDRYWNHLLRGPESRRSRQHSPAPSDRGPSAGEASALMVLNSRPAVNGIGFQDQSPLEMRSRRRRWARALVLAGSGVVLLGAIAIAGTPWTVPGYLVMGSGIACVVAGSATGPA